MLTNIGCAFNLLNDADLGAKHEHMKSCGCGVNSLVLDFASVRMYRARQEALAIYSFS